MYLYSIMIVLFSIYIYITDCAFQRAHRPAELNLSQVEASTKLVDETHFQQVLANIMVPRVVGTTSHQRVKEVS